MESVDKTTVELSVEGMCCSEEAEQVEKALHSLRGVFEIKSLLAAEKVSITYDPKTLSLADIEKTVEGAGFHVKEKGEAKVERQADFSNVITGAFIGVVAVILLGGIVAEVRLTGESGGASSRVAPRPRSSRGRFPHLP